jgi:hypothetical protein
MVTNVLPFLEDFILYVLWMFTLALSFTSSIVLFSHYLRSKATPIGRTAFYFFLNSFWWSVTSTIVTLPIITTNDFSRNYFFLFFPFLASIASILGAYERTRIQILLTPGLEKQTISDRRWLASSIAILVIALVGTYVGIGGLTAWVFVLIGASLAAIALANYGFKIVYISSAILIALGFTIFMGLMLEIETLYSPLPGVPTDTPTALVFILTGFWMLIARKLGLKWWILRIIYAFAILSTVVLAIVTYLSYHPETVSFPVLLLTALVGGALLWRSWKTSIS